MVEISETQRQEFLDEGCFKIPQLLDEAALAACRELYDSQMESPDMFQARFYQKDQQDPNSTEKHFYNETGGNRASMEKMSKLLEKIPIVAETVQKVFGSKSVWFFDMELFKKTGGGHGGKEQLTPFHQDTIGIPAVGLHLGNIWIPFEDVPKHRCLEIAKGTHLQEQLYNSPGVAMVAESVKNTAPTPEQKALMAKQPKPKPLPPMPDLRDPKNGFTLKTWEMKKGDVIMLHPGSMHGGSGVGPEFPERHALVLRFFGDDCIFKTKGLRYSGRFTFYDGGAEGSPPKEALEAQEGDHLSQAGAFLRLLGPPATAAAELFTASGGRSPPVDVEFGLKWPPAARL